MRSDTFAHSVSPFIKHMVGNVGSLRHNRPLRLFIQDSPVPNLGIGNIYASRNPRERQQMWDDLTVVLPGDTSWIIGGDWNMIDQTRDGNDRSQPIVTRLE